MTHRLRTHGSLLVLFSAALLVLAGTLTAFAVHLPEASGSVGSTLLGDADADGYVTISDVTAIQRRVAELPDAGAFSELAADVDGSGEITIDDASLLQRWLAEFETAFKIGEATETTAPTAEPTQYPTDAEGWGREIFQP